MTLSAQGGEVLKLRQFFVVGATGPVLFLTAVLVGGWITPRYSHLSNAVSELTEAGAPLAWPMQTLFALSALAMMFIAGGMLRQQPTIRPLRWAGWLLVCYATMALMLATLLPMDPLEGPYTTSGTLHLVLVGVSALALVAAILLAGHALDRSFGWRYFWPYSIGTVALMAAGGVATPILIENGLPLLGLAERITQAAYLQWLFIYAVRMAAIEQK